MVGTPARALICSLGALAAALFPAAAQAGPPGSPGYCPGDGLIHDWDTQKPIGPCPMGGGLVHTQKGNVWVDPDGNVSQAPTARGDMSNRPYPDNYSPDNAGRPNPRPVPVRPGSS
ncbi:hypothetical protein Srot_1493 [Segniliparus rotundus DSM 44985]|uniref:Uncharacterized protein n=1 Tax=Segniliparus rotundus (strain ATCC BAA-972 / CDC 1076 / CIP 108378 / DSM 44985 / JCM 13578) TaxID=640132 RepID=D6Z7M6_SEGRD|nr:hypothetical protein [Segniliparus rotundus]ADG97956.1 hypothetical protein Srot_1493 [Segniliparus rotundus DSM 44985]